nr:BFH_HP1_G0048490.mRNA.1.CDS.1 [Saccharomyces cerevisiae]
MFFPESKVETYYQESAGVAVDLITTCSGGRNVKVATYMAKTGKSALKQKRNCLTVNPPKG